MELSKFIKQQRKNYKLTQRDLADRAGVGLRFIRELEAGKLTLRMDKVNIVLELFGHQLEPRPLPKSE
jgi:y4mF family transcriptional regulator